MAADLKRFREKGAAWKDKSALALRRPYNADIAHYKAFDSYKYLEKAAACFKIAQQFKEAGNCYRKAAGFADKLPNFTLTAASLEHEAAHAFIKDDPQQAAMCLKASVNLYCQASRFATAARIELELADLYETDKSWPAAQIHAFRASSLFEAATGHSKESRQCMLRAAKCAAQKVKQQRELTGNNVLLKGTKRLTSLAEGIVTSAKEAAKLYENAAERDCTDNLRRFCVPSSLLAGFLAMMGAGDADGAREALVHYEKKFSYYFGASPERLFAANILAAYDSDDLDAFADHVYDFDAVFQLDSLALSSLVVVKEKIEKAIRRQERDSGNNKDKQNDSDSEDGSESDSDNNSDSSDGSEDDDESGSSSSSSGDSSGNSSSEGSGSGSSKSSSSSDSSEEEASTVVTRSKKKKVTIPGYS